MLNQHSIQWFIRYRREVIYWLVSLVILGYPLSAFIVGLSGVSSRDITIPYRVLVFSLAISLLFFFRTHPLRKQLDGLVIIFLLLYLARLSYDWLFAENLYAFDSLVFYLVSLVAISVCVWLAVDRSFNDVSFARRLLIFCILFLAAYYFSWYIGATIVHSQRASLAALNPISLGHAASSVIICAIFIIDARIKLRWKMVSLISLATAAPILLQAGSRGPVIALFVTIIWFMVTKISRSVYLLPLMIIAMFFVSAENFAVHRIIALFGGINELDIAGLARLEYQKLAFIAFFEQPVLGKHFLDPLLGVGSYPHNLFIETAMSMGSVGLFLLFWILLRVSKRIIASVNSTHPLITMFFVYYFLAAMFSGAIWGGDKVFLLMGLILIFGRYDSASFKN